MNVDGSPVRVKRQNRLLPVNLCSSWMLQVIWWNCEGILYQSKPAAMATPSPLHDNYHRTEWTTEQHAFSLQLFSNLGSLIEEGATVCVLLFIKAAASVPWNKSRLYLDHLQLIHRFECLCLIPTESRGVHPGPLTENSPLTSCRRRLVASSLNQLNVLLVVPLSKLLFPPAASFLLSLDFRVLLERDKKDFAL